MTIIGDGSSALIPDGTTTTGSPPRGGRLPRSRRFGRLSVAMALTGGLAVFGAPPIAGAAIINLPGVPINRFNGLNRYDTAAQIATSTFATADTVVLAGGASFADALSGNYLAGNVGGPILLTDPSTLSPETATAFGTLKVRTVLLLGGEAAVSAAVATAISAMNSANAAGGKVVVTRVSGPGRYDTDKAVAETPPASYVATVGGKKTALLASGLKFPDALAGGALAFGAALPVLLTDPAILSPQAAAAMTDLGIQQALILGGPAAISPTVENAVQAMGITTQRLQGPTRTGTAVAIANYAGLTLGWGTAVPASQPPAAAFTHINVALGSNQGGGVDALALGPHAGHEKAPILLTLSSDDPSPDLFLAVLTSAGQGVLTSIDVAGGTGAVSAANAQLITVASGGISQGAMSISPASGTGGTVVTFASVDPCPAAPTGSAARVSILLIANNAPGSPVYGGLTNPIPLGGGPWSIGSTLASGLTPGQYQSLAFCELTFGSSDPFYYLYALDTGPMFTIT